MNTKQIKQLIGDITPLPYSYVTDGIFIHPRIIHRFEESVIEICKIDFSAYRNAEGMTNEKLPVDVSVSAEKRQAKYITTACNEYPSLVLENKKLRSLNSELVTKMQMMVDKEEKEYQVRKDGGDDWNDSIPNVGKGVPYATVLPMPKWVEEFIELINKSK